MSDYETTIIPLSEAQTVLAAFGIGGEDPGYQRWRRDDGFRWVDLEDVLASSQLVLHVDWREWLQDATDTVEEQLASFGIGLDADLGEEGEKGSIAIDGAEENVKYVPNDEDDFDSVMDSVNRLIAGRAQYRKFNSCEGSDGWVYGVLSVEQWDALLNAAPETAKLLFTPVR